MAKYKLLNGVKVQLTSQEETELNNLYDSNNTFEKSMEKLRIKRNRLLIETDYLALSDNTLSAEMTTYRQALRDITNGITTVEQANNVTWPTKP